MLFGFIYPSEAAAIPSMLLSELLAGVAREQADITAEREPPGAPLSQGTLLSWSQHLVDVGEWGFRDARLPPAGTLTVADVARWTAAEK